MSRNDTVKVELLVKTSGLKRGDVVEVSPDKADSLVANRHAVLYAEPKKSAKD